MKLRILSGLAGAICLLAGTGAQALEPLKIVVDGLIQGNPIPVKYAYCAPDQKPGDNISPPISWNPGPIGTKSYAVVMFDKDVPTDMANMNKKGKVIPASMKRQWFYHWLLVDIPVTTTSVPEGKGKDETYGTMGVNDYAKFMKGQPAGTFEGYDGNCPPWNDALLHHYFFRVYALDVESLDLPEDFTGSDAMRAIGKHMLARGELMGTYTLNPKLMGR